jgi:hypothetical protein
VCETSKQEHATGFKNSRMARIPGFSYTNTLPTYEQGGSGVDLTPAAEAKETSIRWPDQGMVAVRTHIPMDVRFIYDRLLRLCCWSSAVF